MCLLLNYGSSNENGLHFPDMEWIVSACCSIARGRESIIRFYRPISANSKLNDVGLFLICDLVINYFIVSFQVWMLILISLFVVVGMMTIFTWFYNRSYKKDLEMNAINVESNQDDTKPTSLIRNSIFNYFSFHMIYTINILTNQGKLLLT